MRAQSRSAPSLQVKVWGDAACFTRPEMKVERVTYPVMTPSAARGALESIFWKPEVSWRIRRIHVLRPIRHLSILRNEVKSRASERAARGWEKRGGGFFAEENHTPRHTLALRDVAYVIEADQVLSPHTRGKQSLRGYQAQFERRVQKGQCFRRPFLGCREFACFFGPPDPTEVAIEHSDELGRMLFDIDYLPDGSGRGQPVFFQARLDRGILHVPDSLYDQLGSEGAGDAS